MVNILAFFFCCVSLHVQADRPVDLNTLLFQLKSNDWSARLEAYEEIRADPNLLSQPKAKQGLIDLVDRENAEIEKTFNESGGATGVEQKYGDEYSQYVSELFKTANRFMDWDDPKEVCIIAHEAYHPSSPFAEEIASHGKVAISCLLKMARSPWYIERYKANPILVKILTLKGLLATDTAAAQDCVHRALHDESVMVRLSTIRAMKNFGDSSMIPDLQDVAAQDPDQSAHGVRTKAAEAISAIKARQ